MTTGSEQNRLAGSRWTFKAPPSHESVDPAQRPPTFAVIIAAYQAADTIGSALDSVLEQTRAPDEIVICDDGSTDDLEAALRPYADRITLVRQANGGEAAAKNAAARAASSDYVVILDADDHFCPERLEAIAGLATARPDLDVIATDTHVELDGEQLGLQSDLHDFPTTAGGQRAELLRHCIVWVPAIRRQRLLEIGGFDPSVRVGTDWDCWIRLVLGGSLLGLVDAPLYRYKLARGSLSSNDVTRHRGNVQILERALEHPSLTAAERTIVEKAIRLYRSTADLAEARDTLLRRLPGARRAAWRVVSGRGIGWRSRAKAALSIVAPGVARRLLRRRPESAHPLAGSLTTPGT